MNPFFSMLAIHEAAVPAKDPLVAEAEEFFARLFRDDYHGIAERLGQKRCSDLVNHPDWSAEREELQEKFSDCLQCNGKEYDLAEIHARFVLYAIEACAYRRTADDCRILIGDIYDFDTVSVVWNYA